MTPEVKERIEQIRNGNVPEGYIKGKDGIHPCDWTAKKMGQWLKLAERPVVLKDDEVYQLVTVRRGFGGVGSRGYYLGKSVLVKNYFSVNAGDFIISKRQIAHGACGVVPEELDGAVVSNEYNVFIPQDGTNIQMFNLMMQLPHYKRLYYLMSDGVHIEKLLFKTQDWMRRSLAMPPLEEQKKIAEILTTQDKVIELKEKLLAEKQRQKKYLMQQLLTGKKRLPGFDDGWETAKSVFDFKKGEQINGIELNDTFCYPMYNGGVTYSGYTRNTNCENAIIISEGGNSCGFVNYVDGKFWAGGHCYFVTHSKLPYIYLYQLLKLKEPYIMSLRVGSGLPNIQKSALECLELTYPVDPAEQNAIAYILIAADKEIDLLRQDIEQEKQKKKALMQLLLMGIVRV